MKRRPFVLIVCDGWGEAPPDYPREFNAVAQARLPFRESLLKRYPHTLVDASGNAVGLPDGVMGNSEVGHMNLGAGRIVWQEITRIDKAIEKDDCESIAALCNAVQKAKASGKKLHLMGLTSNGAVHSVDRHYFGLLRLAKRHGLTGEQVVVHCFTDGRDTPPKMAQRFVAEIQDWINSNGCGVIATVSGRYYAMDRDKRWQRTKLAYDAMVKGEGIAASGAIAAVRDAHAAGENDEFIKPRVIVDKAGKPVARIEDGDQVICFNYRADRVRQISRALTEESFDGFEREPLKVHLTTMTQYIHGLPADIAFPPQYLRRTIGEIFGELGKKQLRIAETEKYPHVSYFFSGGEEKPFPGEERILIQSPQDVATYDLKPEMSAPGIAAALVEQIQQDNFDLIINNYANADMVGHTGVVSAVISACEAVDEALSHVVPAILKAGGTAIITADHGNAEQLWDFQANSPQTQHTTNPVPLILVDENSVGARLRAGGKLCDVAPTIMQMLGLQPPAEMDGKSLLQ